MGIDPDVADEMLKSAQNAEVEERREQIRQGPDGEDCPYCGKPVNQDNLHLTCW